MPEAPSNLRARVACKLCNGRRVKCDRSLSGRTCSNCQQAGSPCELIESKRGKHKRLRNKKQHEESSPQAPEVTMTLEEAVSNPPTPAKSSDQSPRRAGDTRRYVSPSLPDFIINKEPENAGERVVYMGDSANMKYVIHEVGDPFKNSTAQYKLWGDNLQRCMTEKLGVPTQLALKNLRSQDDQHLRNLGAFQFPEKRISDEMVRTFFEYSYPVFPVFNRAEFMASYGTGRLSPLVLNAVLFVAAIHCSDSILQELGFASRYLACLTFYRRAKALNDADYEADGIATVQALALLVNWWGGPMEQKDTWHWLGAAASFAQALGMHRTKSYAVLLPLHQKLWRRIWWVLYIHDMHYAAVFGRPPHIHQDFCDITPLSEDDFTDCGYEESSRETESKLYIIHLANLACRVGNCLFAKFSSVHDPATEQARYQDLVDFENILPLSFKNLPPHITAARGLWPSLIQLYHCDYQIVFHRMLSDAPDNGVTFVAAGKISRILEDLLASGTLYQTPFMVFPAIFASILVHIIHIRKGNPDMLVIAEHRARLAMHILDRFQDAWPLVIWTRHLLDCLLKGSAAPAPTRPGELVEQQTLPAPVPGQHQYSFDNEHGRRTHVSGGGRLGTTSVENEDMSSTQQEPEPAMFSEADFSSMSLMFPLNNMLEDAGLSPDSWLFDYNNLDAYP